MRVDLHCHSEWSPDSRSPLEDIVAGAQRAGLDVLALTDHDVIDGARKLREIAPLPIIVGEEVNTAEGEIIGLFLTDWVPPGLSPEETIARIHGQGGIAYVPHPFDVVRGSTLSQTALHRVAHLLDAVEGFNSRCLLEKFNDDAVAFAKARGLPVGAGSDAHAAHQVGMAYAEVPPFDPTSPTGLLAALREAELSGTRLGGLGRLVPKLAKARRTLQAWRERQRPP
jgi:predicted metal-dependent phosphoesterase TrpH